MREIITFGIDEAGLGPKLGPLVVTAVGFETVGTKGDTSIDRRLAAVVQKKAPLEGTSLSVDDSKVLYRGGAGLGQLEKTALAFFYAQHGRLPGNLQSWVEVSGLKNLVLEECPWYGVEPLNLELPRMMAPDLIEQSGRRLRTAMKRNGIHGFSFKQQVVTAPVLNREIERLGLKSEALAEALAELVLDAKDRHPDSDLVLHIDKLGGRTYYAPLLHRIFPMTSLARLEERRAVSSYRLEEEKATVRVNFYRKGDQLHLPIALASMLSKYIREQFMHLFNQYWKGRMPLLKPTAGYPTDAARFLEEVRNAGFDVRPFLRVK